MTLREVKEWLNQLPETYDDYQVCHGRIGKLDDEFMYRRDDPIAALSDDSTTKEILFMTYEHNLTVADIGEEVSAEG